MTTSKLPENGALQAGKPLQMTQLEVAHHSDYDRDRERLARLGKKQVLKRNFGFMSMLGFSCTIMVTWEGVLVLFIQGFSNGGPAGLVYGFLFIWLGTLCVFISLGELASMAPTSGGQYHWVAMLAPPSSQRFLSYITGWLTVAGWQALAASGGYLCGTLIQGLIVLNNPTYHPQNWQGTLLFWAAIFFAVIFNTVISGALPQIESLILVIHVMGFFAILIPLVYLAPHGSASEVFTLFLNAGNWPTQGLSFFVGLIGLVFSFLGTDGAIHMSEEIENAAVNVPRSMITSILLNGSLGFGMLLGLLFCLGDIDQVLSTPPLQYPFMVIFLQATESVAGSSAMAAVVTVLGLCATIAFVATSSRLYWAFARDRGLPFATYLSKVDQRTSIPLFAVLLTTIVACLLALINIGSAVAFNDVISLTVNGLYCSYLICCVLLLYRRCKGHISTRPDDAARPMRVTRLTWGPFRVAGILGIAINTLAVIYLVIILFFSFWPPATPTTASTMNYSVLVMGAVILFSIFYYIVIASKTYGGPLMEIDVQ